MSPGSSPPPPRARVALPVLAREPAASAHAAVLPPLYARWLDALLPTPLEPEPRASCHDCAMTPTPGAPVTRDTFHPDSKCCTYHPSLPNFLVGSALRDASPGGAAGRARLRARIAARVRVSPLGVERDAAFAALYRASRGEVFGRASSLRCPLYLAEQGGCGVWAHRNAVCATWFCKHTHGGAGARVWRVARKLLALFEGQLAWWAAAQAGLDGGALAANFAPDEGLLGEPYALDADALDGRPDEGRYALQWGAFEGREEAFYVACYEAVAALDGPRAVQLAGAEAAVLAGLLREALDELARPFSERVPDNAVLTSLRATPGPLPSTARVEGYSPYDPALLPQAVVAALACFDGRPLDEARAAASERAGVPLDDELLVRLCDFGVLTPVRL